MNRPLPLATVLLAAAAGARAQDNSTLPRGDFRANDVRGVSSTALGGNADAGFGMFQAAAPAGSLRDRGTLVATPRLAYCAYVDHDAASNVVVEVRRSTDGGRTWGAPVVAYTADTAGGEDLDTGTEQILLRAWQDEVYLALLTNTDDRGTLGGGNGQGVYVVASNDQGRTFSAPIRVTLFQGMGNLQYDVDLMSGVAAASGFHLCWEYDLQTATSESIAYARLGFRTGSAAVEVPEQTLNIFVPGTFDVDNPRLDADGRVVHVAWADNRNGSNDVFSRTSFDGGLSFTPEFNHTNGAASVGAPDAAVDGAYAYTFSEDSRAGGFDLVHMDRGTLDFTNSAVNWNNQGVAASIAPNDTDWFGAEVDGGLIAVLYEEDRSGANEGFLAVDPNAGADFIAGTIVEHQLTTGLDPTLYDLAVRGNMICAVWEECGFPEGAGIALGHDHGGSVDVSHFTSQSSCNGGRYDVDDLVVALTGNDDYVVVYADERNSPGSNADEDIWITGGKYPYAVDNTQVDGTVLMQRVDPAESTPNHLAFVMISGTGTSPGTAVFGNDHGFHVGLTQDLWFDAMLGTPLLSSVNASGDVVFSLPAGPGMAPGNIPRLSSLLGMPFWLAGGTYEVGDPTPFTSFTDPIVF